MVPTEATLGLRISCHFVFLVSNLSQIMKESGQWMSGSYFCHGNARHANTVFILNFPKPGGITLWCTNVSSSWGKCCSPINKAFLFILGRMHIHHTNYSQRHHTQISKIIFIGSLMPGFHFISFTLTTFCFPLYTDLVFVWFSLPIFTEFELELYRIFRSWS